MTDLARVLARLEADPRFGADLRADPRAALSPYQLSDAEFAQVEHALDASSPPSTGPGMQTLFAAKEPARASWPSRPWQAALVGVLAVGALAGFGLSSRGAGADDPAAGVPGAASALELTPVAYSSCPAAAAATTHLGDFHRGDQVWVVGRDDSGGWLQVRSPSGDRVWVAASAVTANDVEHLAVVPCDLSDLASAAGPTDPSVADPGSEPLVPGGTTPTTGGGATPSTTVPTGATPSPPTSSTGVTPTTTIGAGSPSTTGPPVTNPTDHDGPVIQKAGAAPPDIWEHSAGAGGRCVTQTSSTVTASISDASGVTDVQLDWVQAGSSRHGTIAMSRSGSTWTASVGPFEWSSGAVPSSGADIGITLRARDGAGNTSSAGTTLHLHSAEECIG